MEYNYTSPITVAEPLYAGANWTYSDLSWGEQRWVDWYTYMGNPTIATGVMSFILHEVRWPPGPASSRWLIFARSLFTLGGVSRGSSSTQSPTSADGNSSQYVLARVLALAKGY